MPLTRDRRWTPRRSLLIAAAVGLAACSPAEPAPAPAKAEAETSPQRVSDRKAETEADRTAERSRRRAERRRGRKADKKKEKKKAKPTGPKHVCNVCGSKAVFTGVKGRESATCPVCKCTERHRTFIHYLAHSTKLLHKKLDVLHFSPNECEETALRHQPNWHYVTTDYMHHEDLRLDLTNADQPDDSWDLVILYHVLEHIPDDIKAMSELYRIIRPGGRAILQVPLEAGVDEIYEDPTITDPKERKKHFGQSDHVRKYSPAGLRERLEAAGFEIEVVDYLGQLDPAVVEKHQLSGAFDPPLDESIWIATKPKRKRKR